VKTEDKRTREEDRSIAAIVQHEDAEAAEDRERQDIPESTLLSRKRRKTVVLQHGRPHS
jgi:hypothetical protein